MSGFVFVCSTHVRYFGAEYFVGGNVVVVILVFVLESTCTTTRSRRRGTRTSKNVVRTC